MTVCFMIVVEVRKVYDIEMIPRNALADLKVSKNMRKEEEKCNNGG